MDEKIKDRIRRLYAMSMETETSPNEAAIAAKRVRKMMDEHGVTMEDLETSEFSDEMSETGHKQMPKWYSVLALGVGVYNDCITVIKQGKKGKKHVVFQGYETDSQGAIWMFDYLISTMERMLKNTSVPDEETARVFNGQFRMGYASDMQKRLMTMAAEREEEQEQLAGDGKSLVIAKKDMVENKYGKQQISRRSTRSYTRSSGREEGRRASQRTGLNSQVQGSAARKQLT